MGRALWENLNCILLASSLLLKTHSFKKSEIPPLWPPPISVNKEVRKEDASMQLLLSQWHNPYVLFPCLLLKTHWRRSEARELWLSHPMGLREARRKGVRSMQLRSCPWLMMCLSNMDTWMSFHPSCQIPGCLPYSEAYLWVPMSQRNNSHSLQVKSTFH